MIKDNINHPQHYGGKDNPYETIKVIEAWNMDFNLGNAIKYISRAGKKNNKMIEDLQKAVFYINREIENISTFIKSFENDGIESDKEAKQKYLKNVLQGIKKRPPIVCLCGSSRFYEEFTKQNFRETMKGNIVLSMGFYPHSSKEAHGTIINISPEVKTELDELHKRKIDLADEVFILNVDGYIGDSTKSEIEYANNLNKKIRYLCDYTNGC